MPSASARKQSTVRQQLGRLGENFVVSHLNCPVCKAEKPHSLLPANTPCVDLICNTCHLQSQVKTISVRQKNSLPKTVLGGSWTPKEKTLATGIFNPYFFIFVENGQVKKILYLPSNKQTMSMFKVRKPLSSKAKSPGWTGYQINLQSISEELVEIAIERN